MLVFAAIGVFGAGMLAIAAGIPIKEFGFGNTLILSGVLAWCTSAIMVTLWACVRDLKQHLDKSLPRRAETDAAPATSRPSVSDSPAAPQGWPETIPDRSSQPPAAVPLPAAPMPAVPPPAEPRAPRRNLLFASTRKPREAAASDMPLASAPAAGPLESRAPLPLEEPRSAPRRSETPPSTPPRAARPLSTINPRDPVTAPPLPPSPAAVAPPPVPPPLPEPAAPPADAPPPRNAGPRADVAAAVTVLKSGVVDGMAYWLYSDGSIEAQMPEGMMRFGSIDELRAHLDKRA